MNIDVDDEFLEIAREIVAENRTEPEWDEIASDDMFQSAHYCGGFEGDSEGGGEFTFSLYRDDGEWWICLSLEQIRAVAEGTLRTVSARAAER